MIEIKSNDYRAWLNKSVILSRLTQFEKSIDALNESERYMPKIFEWSTQVGKESYRDDYELTK